MSVITNNKDQCAAALDALRQVVDPEIGLNVVDLGLIYRIDLDERGQSVHCTMTLTTSFCPMGEAISNGVEVALQRAFPGYAIQLELTFDPPWSQELISKEGLNFLKQ